VTDRVYPAKRERSALKGVYINIGESPQAEKQAMAPSQTWTGSLNDRRENDFSEDAWRRSVGRGRE